MVRYLEQKEAYKKCKEEKKILLLSHADETKASALFESSEIELSSAEIIKNNISKNGKNWSSVFKLTYDALHELVESFLLLQKITSNNHQCLFVYLCENFPDFDFSWEFFERVRTIRNGINYYGQAIDFEEWNELELNFKLHISKLRKEIELAL